MDFEEVYRIKVDELDKKPKVIELKETIHQKQFHLMELDDEEDMYVGSPRFSSV